MTRRKRCSSLAQWAARKSGMLEDGAPLAGDGGRRDVAALLDAEEGEEGRHLVGRGRERVQEAEGEGGVHAGLPSPGKTR